MDQSFGTRARPFCFDTEFAASAPSSATDAAGLSLEVAALRAETEALRADQGRALEQARNEAFLQGLAQARAEREEALLNAVDALHAEWADFAESRDAMIEHLREEACALARALGDALAARALEREPAAAIDEALGNILSQIARGQEVAITVHPDLVGDVEARIARRQSQDRRKLNLIVSADSAIAMGDAHMRWDGGGLRLDMQARAKAILAELQAMGAA